jgi:hypothetical protein
MGAADYSVSFSAPIAASSNIAPGQVAVPVPNGTTYTIATAAARAGAPAGATPLFCLFGSTGTLGAFTGLQVGVVPPTQFNLGPGAATFVGIDVNGNAVRTATGDPTIIGTCDGNGTITIAPWAAALASTIASIIGSGAIATLIGYPTSIYIQASDITTFDTGRAITAATATAPIVCTCPGTTLVTGNVVTIPAGSYGLTGLAGTWEVSVSGSAVTLLSSSGTGAYTGGATLFSANLNLAAVWNRIYANTNFGVFGGRVFLEELDQMNAILQARGLPPVTSCVLNDSGAQLAWNWPNSLSVYGPHVEIIGPGTANMVQLRSPSGAQTTRASIAAFHGAFYTRGLVFRGDPNAPLAGFYSVAADANIVLQLSSFWRISGEISFHGCGATTAVLDIVGVTGPNALLAVFSACGVAPLSSTRQVATGVLRMQGSGEDGLSLEPVFQAGQIPQFAVPNKAYGLGPNLCMKEWEAAGVNTGNGYIIRNATFTDSSSVAIYIAPQAAGTVSGVVKLERCYFEANAGGNAAAEGGAIVASNCTGLIMERCADNRNNLASSPLLAFGVPYQVNVGGAGGTTTVMGPFKIIENQTPLYATTTVLPVTLSGATRPASMLEEFGNIMAWYMVVQSGQSATASLLAMVSANDNSSYAFNGSTVNPNGTAQTAPVSTPAQYIIGTFLATGAANAYVPIARLNTEGVPVQMVNDGNAAIAASSVGAPIQVMPSPSVAGKVRLSTSVTNGVGMTTTAIPTTGTATGFVIPRAA